MKIRVGSAVATVKLISFTIMFNDNFTRLSYVPTPAFTSNHWTDLKLILYCYEFYVSCTTGVTVQSSSANKLVMSRKRYM